MAFSGDLRTMVLTDVLQWLASRRKAGTLGLQRHSTRKQLGFAEGRLSSSWSNDPRETLGQALIRERIINEQDLFEALLRQEKDKRRLGEILISEGRLTEEQLLTTLRRNAEEIVYDLFLWADGQFDFRDEEEKQAPGVSLDIDTMAVIQEGIRRLEQWHKIRSRFPSSEVTFKVQRQAYGIEDEAERQILGLAAAGKPLAAIALESRRSEYEAAFILISLCDRGALSVGEIRGGGAESDPVGAIWSLLRTAAQRLKEQRWDAAREAYEEVLGLDRINQEAKKGLVAVAEGRAKARLARKVPLDKVPVLRMGSVALSQEKFDAQEGFVLSRVNGQWDIRSILKLCPMSEEDALLIFGRLAERHVVDFVEAPPQAVPHTPHPAPRRT
jgi:hypothetical protein